MPLFGRSVPDTRPREYVVRHEPLITADSMVVLVDLVVRFDARPDPDDGPPLGWHPDGEDAVEAVVLTILRLTAERADRSALLGERTLLAEPVEHALALAPVAGGYSARVASLEVHEHDADAVRSQEFVVV